MKHLLIVTDLSFPGSAMASRLLAFTNLFNALGYDVHIIAGKTSDKSIELNHIYWKNNYSFEIVKSKRGERLQSYIGNENLNNAVDKYLTNNGVNLVFTTSLNANFKKVYRTCRKHNKKIILEQCEWYDPSSFSFKKYDPRYIRFNNNFKNEYKKVDGIIAISRLLEDYFKNKTKTIRIPSITDVNDKEPNYELDTAKIRLVFTGNPSNSKELLKPVLETLDSNDTFKDRITLDIYGTKESKIRAIIKDDDLLNRLNDVVNIKGFVSQDSIENILKESHFQIFIRPDRRSSNAGFPTKLCESLSVGTPCITNNTGDISLVLKDGYNGYFSKGTKKEDVIEVFNRIVNLTNEEYNELRRNSYASALGFFDYSLYTEKVSEFIENL